MMIKKICLLLIVTLVSVLCLAKDGTTTNKKYPPYLDVWGYDLSNYQSAEEGHIGIDPYQSADGDIVFIVNIDSLIATMDEDKTNTFEERYNNTKFVAIKFFKGEFINLKGKDLEGFKSKNNLKRVKSTDTVTLHDDTMIQTHLLSGGNLCQYNELAQKVILKGKLMPNKTKLSFDDNDVEKISIIGSSLNIDRYIEKEDGLCDRGGPGGGELIYKQLYFLPSEIIDLKDDTFIIFGKNFIIRFDKDFNTKFKNIQHTYPSSSSIDIMKGKFFVLPYSKIMELDVKTAQDHDHGVQGLHDRLWLYLYNQFEQKK